MPPPINRNQRIVNPLPVRAVLYYAYGDFKLKSRLYEDTLIISMSLPPLKLPKFTFGCANSALAEPIGIAGFGRGALSLPAQLATTSPKNRNYFYEFFDGEEKKKVGCVMLMDGGDEAEIGGGRCRVIGELPTKGLRWFTT
ncbi:hypothetical protein DH2020_019597 [Rehmannia glutinosa]|uniref:Xylanase inhibitor N-terminal domain-containing protein n=1 Tax=Rehmannia glutinosa TaxID=99300 RepID=A0ABR0WNC7_REHGL